MRRSSRFPTALGRSPLTSAPGDPDCAAMKSLRSVAVAAALLAACSQPSAPQGPAEVQLSTDLNPGMVDAALTMIARSGGPRGERIAGMHAGVSALPGAAGAPVPGAEQTPKPAESGDVRWDSEPFGAIAAAARGELLPAPQTGSDEAAKAAASAAHVLPVYPNQKSIGTFVWPTALSIAKSTRNPEAARKLAERLADRNTEQLLVARVPGYLPLRNDIPVPPGVRSAANLVVVSVDPARLVSEIGQRKAARAAWAESIPKR